MPSTFTRSAMSRGTAKLVGRREVKHLGHLRSATTLRPTPQAGLDDVAFDQFDAATRVRLGQRESSDGLRGQRRPARLDQTDRTVQRPVGQQSRKQRRAEESGESGKEENRHVVPRLVAQASHGLHLPRRSLAKAGVGYYPCVCARTEWRSLSSPAPWRCRRRCPRRSPMRSRCAPSASSAPSAPPTACCARGWPRPIRKRCCCPTGSPAPAADGPPGTRRVNTHRTTPAPTCIRT